jgi:protein NrfD
MALGGLGLFFLEGGAGTALLLLFFPTRQLGKGFFSLHGALAFVFLLFATLVEPAGLPPSVAVGACALLALYALASHGGRAAMARPLLAAGAAFSVWALVRVALVAPRGAGDAWTVAGALLGGLFFGAVLLTMNLGHWYLVSRSLPFQLLARGATLFAGLAAARTVLLGLAMASDASREGLAALLSLEHDALFFLFRVLWGILGPLALSYFIWKTADMRSNQAATGLLYVALVFVLIGELLSSYLTVATGFPA